MGGGTKEHADKIRKSNFNRQRAETETLRSNCGSEGYVFGADQAKGQCEFHHVVPISSVQDGNINVGDAAKLDYVRKCMAATTWDINEQPNLLGLPTKGPYAAADAKTAGRNKTGGKVTKVFTLAELKALDPAQEEFGALPDLPCHLNDHDKFTAAVISKLNRDVWPDVLKKGEACDNKARSIRAALRGESNHWKDWLISRGGQHGGAADCWVNRANKPDTWYIPLSMAPKPRKQQPPPNANLQGATVKAWMEKIFEWGG